MNRFFVFIGLSLLLGSCHEHHALPIMGNRSAIEKVVDGKTVIDTLYATVPNFAFVNQDGDSVTQENVKGKIYIADFFFTSCPTICPVMKKQLIRVYDKFKTDPNFLILSHTIDPEYDTLALLKDYCSRLGSDGKHWMFLRGNREATYDLAEKGYYSTALPDSTAPGGFVHSGGFILVDSKGRVRGIYDGTEEKAVDHLMEDILILKEEK
ncbi:MAG: SCO family protein [Bacteroidetes bacterium B1(2017)]|nr:MAG: SCO family protein [Bacteroidetes bacterium B1(2017)]